MGDGCAGRASASELERTRAVVAARLSGQPVTVWLFGSWARGEASAGSDVDLAVEALAPLPIGLLAELREDLEEAAIVARVEVVNLAEASPELRAEVAREGIQWTV